MPEDKQSKQPEPHRAAPRDARLQQPEAPEMLGMLGTVAALAGALCLIVGLLWWIVAKIVVVPAMVFLILAGVLLIFGLVVHFKSLVGLFRERRAVSGLNTLVYAALVFGIIVLVNFIAVRHQGNMPRLDATKNKQFSLADQTRKVVKSLNQDLEIIGFYTDRNPTQGEVRQRLEQYQKLSNRVKLSFYDPNIKRAQAQEHNVTMDGTIIVKSGERKETVTVGDEERITSAILAVTTGQKTKVYFLTGHGECSPTQYADDSCTTIKQTLESQQYEVETLSLLSQSDPVVPQDCAVLVIAGAKHPLQAKELAAIEKYADQAGRLLITLASTPDAPDFAGILSKRGVTPLKGQVLEAGAEHQAFGDKTLPLVMDPEPHKITEKLQALVLPMARGLQIDAGPEPPPSYPGAPPPPGQKAQALLMSSAEAWLDVPQGETPANKTKDPGEQTGPLALAAVIDESKKDKPPTMPGMPPEPEDGEDGPMIVVIGSTEFMTDGFYNSTGLRQNPFLVLNSIAWLVANEKLISIPPKEQEVPYLTMVGSQKAIAVVTALFIIPGLVVLAGGFVWWRRRR